MADDLGRHTLPHLALGLWVDRQREVRVRLDVDKARRHRQTRGIDRPGRSRRQRPAERRDPPVMHGDIGDLIRPPAAVDDEPAADDDVVAHGPPLLSHRRTPVPISAMGPGLRREDAK